jgi:hypothetical protein
MAPKEKMKVMKTLERSRSSVTELDDPSSTTILEVSDSSSPSPQKKQKVEFVLQVTIESDGEPCEESLLRRAEEETQPDKKMTLAEEEEEADAERAGSNDMSWASSTALPCHGLRLGERFVDFSKPEAEEQHPPSPPPDDKMALAEEDDDEPASSEKVARGRRSKRPKVDYEARMIEQYQPWPKVYYEYRLGGLHDQAKEAAAKRKADKRDAQRRRQNDEAQRQTTQMPEPMVDVAARIRSSMPEQIGNAMVDEVRRILEAESQDHSQRLTEDSGTGDGDTPEPEPMVNAVLRWSTQCSGALRSDLQTSMVNAVLQTNDAEPASSQQEASQSPLEPESSQQPFDEYYTRAMAEFSNSRQNMARSFEQMHDLFIDWGPKDNSKLEDGK